MNSKVEAFIRNSLNNLSSGYLVYSRFIEDAISTGDEFCQLIFCENHTGCGSCINCRKFLSGNMLSFFQVKDDGSGTIRIGQVREIQDYLNTQAKDHEYRCIHIKGTEKLTEQSQNYLLKTLEEPPANVVFILSSSNKDMILETVKSRCIEINVPVASKEEIVSRLVSEGNDELSAITAASWSRGSFAGAQSALSDENVGRIRDLAEKIVLRLCTKKNPSIFLLMQDFGEAGDSLTDLLYSISTLLTDSVIYPAEPIYLNNPDKEETLRLLKGGFTLKKLEGIIEAVNKRIEQKTNYPQFRDDLMIENMIFEILEVMACQI